jgi:hypothetical protein
MDINLMIANAPANHAPFRQTPSVVVDSRPENDLAFAHASNSG